MMRMQGCPAHFCCQESETPTGHGTAGSGERKKKLSCVTNAGFVISFFSGLTRATRSKWISYLGRFRVTDTIFLEAVTALYCPYIC